MNNMEQVLKELKTALLEKKAGETSSSSTKSFHDRENNLPFALQQKIYSIMDNFDFEKVQKVMENVGWRWAFAKDGIPSVSELKNEAHRLLVDACESETNVATGGFKAVFEKSSPWEDDDDPYVGLEFVLEECEGYV
jgi:hypothetical protein